MAHARMETGQANVQDAIAGQVPQSRREEIRRYLRLFGYKPEGTILQVYLAGSLGRRTPTPMQARRQAAAAARYRGTTFAVVGRTHDPSILASLVPPRSRRGQEPNPGYKGYLFVEKDPNMKPPDELLPLDFTPASLVYPPDWKEMFKTRGFLIAMHVPSDFAHSKNNLTNRLRRIRGSIDTKKQWEFLDELKEYGYFATRPSSVGG